MSRAARKDTIRNMPTILLVEDDPPLRELARRALEATEGLVLLEARNGAQALDLAAAQTDPITLLITDIDMPHVDGFTLRERLRELHPETRALYMTGRAGDSVAIRGGLKETGEPYLLKPFTKDAFLSAVEAALADRQDRTPEP